MTGFMTGFVCDGLPGPPGDAAERELSLERRPSTQKRHSGCTLFRVRVAPSNRNRAEQVLRLRYPMRQDCPFPWLAGHRGHTNRATILRQHDLV